MQAITPKIASDLASLVYDIRTPTARGIYRFNRHSESTRYFDFDLSDGPVTGVTGTWFDRLMNRRTGFAIIGKGKDYYRDHVAVAIRGTKMTSGRDWLTNGNVGISGSDTGSSVHAGFNRAFQSMKPLFEQSLSPLVQARTTVHCVGHSLGGALASLTADWVKARYGCNVNLYTFGAPRVGLRNFAMNHTGSLGSSNIFRCTHGADPVPLVPLWPFHHAPLDGLEYRLDYGQGIDAAAHGMHATDTPGYVNTANSDDWGILNARSNEIFTPVVLDYEQRHQASFTSYWAEKIGNALLTLLKNAGKLSAIMAQATIGTGLTFYDLLARTLEEVAAASVQFAEQTRGLLGHMLVFARQAVTTVRDLSFSFIRWVFDRTLGSLYRAARNAIDYLS